MNPRHGAGGWGLGLLLVLLSACPTEIPASLLLTVKSAPDVPAVESVRVRVFDEAGQAHPATPFSVAAPDAERKLGTLVIHPQTTTEGSAGAALRLRIQADGLARGATVASAVLAVTLEPGRQITRTIVLMAVASQGAGDGDGDGVPDVIDNCPHAANPDQNDRDRDGKGDVCDGQAGATGNDGGHADAAADAPRDVARDTLDAPAPDNAAATDTTALGRGLGEGCTAAAGCDSGHCVDGVCCESVCSGGCWSCAQPGHSGRCVAVPAGERDPRGQCAGEAAESCGNDGACDGAGACRKHAAGTVCRPGRCAETGERVLPALCDGAGACAPARTQSCAPFACAGDVCKTDCASAQDCARGVSCNAGSCGKRPLGAGCSSGGDCNSGHCVDGVCCDVASCSGPCRACNLPGSAGSCQNFVANAVPRASGCSAEATSSCGRTGKCDGAGGCQLWTAGTPCRARSCAGTTESPASTCNGVGACVASNNRSCGAYSCAGDACATGCSNDSTCAAGNFCRMGACLPAQANGSTCSTGRECRSGFCVDGHCCGSSGCGANMACTGPGGTCIGRRQLGTACTTNGECVTGICADGVCCATACTDACRRCDGSPAGVCIPITSGRDSNASSPCVAPRRCEQGGVCR